MIKVGVVMLTNTADEEIFKMTLEALRSLHLSEHAVHFNVILVESNPAVQPWNYRDHFSSLLVLPYNGEEFNYNAALNQGIDYFSKAYGEPTYFVVANNDLIFEKGWFTKLKAAMELYDLDVASPWCPGWSPHEQELGQDEDIHFGHRTSYEFCGWCFCITSEALRIVTPLDEAFVFEHQDNDFVDQLVATGHDRMALVVPSRVQHLLNQSHRLIPESRRYEMFEGSGAVYWDKRQKHVG